MTILLEYKNKGLRRAIESMFGRFEYPLILYCDVGYNTCNYKYNNIIISIDYEVEEFDDGFIYTCTGARRVVKNKLELESLARFVLASFLKNKEASIVEIVKKEREEQRNERAVQEYKDRNGFKATTEEIEAHFISKLKEVGLYELHLERIKDGL